MTALLELDRVSEDLRAGAPARAAPARPAQAARCGAGREPAGRARRRARPGWRKRLREIDAGADHHAAGAHDQRRRCASTEPTSRRWREGRCSRSGAGCKWCSRTARPRSIRARRCAACSAKASSSPAVAAADRAGAITELLEQVGLDRSFVEPLSAPALRRTAPARRHCARAGDAAGAAGRGRAGVLARRLAAGANPAPADRVCGASLGSP